jgi:tetratricopeptide (TPR) repeat protein
LAEAYEVAGRFDKALERFEEARARRETTLGPDHPETLRSLAGVAGVKIHLEQFDESLAMYQQALGKLKAKVGPEHPATLVTQHGLAMAYYEMEKFDIALPIFKQTLPLMQRKLGPNHQSTISDMHGLALTHLFLDHVKEAVSLLEEARDRAVARLGPDHYVTVRIMGNLGVAYSKAGEQAKALPLLEEARKKIVAERGPDDRDAIAALISLGSTYSRTKQYDKAIEIYKQALTKQRVKPGSKHPRTLTTIACLAEVYRDAGQLQNAEKMLEELLRRADDDKDPESTYLIVMIELAPLYEELGKLQQAEALWTKQLAICKRKYGPDEEAVAVVQAKLARNLLLQKKFDKAETQLRECLTLYAKVAPGEWMRFHAMSLLGLCLLGQKQYPEAEPLLLEGYEGLKKREAQIPANWKSCLSQVPDWLWQLYKAWGKPEKAAEWEKKSKLAMLQRGVTLVAQRKNDEAEPLLRDVLRRDPKSGDAHGYLGLVLLRQSKLEEAASELRRAIDIKPEWDTVHVCLGIVLARQGHWDKATASFRQGVALEPNTQGAWEQLAVLCLFTGDHDGYRRACRELLTRFGKSNDLKTLNTVAWTCLQAPGTSGELEPLLKIAQSLDPDNSEKAPWHGSMLRLKGLADYRAGHFADALEKLTACPADDAGGRADATTFVLRSLALHGLNRGEEARAALEKARIILDKTMPNREKGRPFGDDWHYWLECQILFREAGKLLNKE